MAKCKSIQKDGKKLCTQCNQWKSMTEFSPDRRKPDGTIYYKPVCKACNNGHQKKGLRERSQKEQEPVEGLTVIDTVHYSTPDKKDVSILSLQEENAVTVPELAEPSENEVSKLRESIYIPKQEVHQSTPDRQESSRSKPLTGDEIKAIRNLLKIVPDIEKVLKTGNIEEDLLRGQALAKTFKVYSGVLDRFNQYMSERPGEKIQDIVSSALIEYMNNH